MTRTVLLLVVCSLFLFQLNYSWAAVSTSASASSSTSLAVPVVGLASGLPLTNCVGTIVEQASGVLGALAPALSIVGAGENIVIDVLNLVSSDLTAAELPTTGVDINISISLPACGVIKSVLTIGGDILLPVESLVADLLNAITGGIQISSNAGIWCQAGPGCRLLLANICLNGIKISEDLVVNGGSVNNLLSVVIDNNLLLGCSWTITATLQLDCATSLLTDTITQCRFLFGIL